ncbi:inorganic phosphate transporter [Bacillus sp. Marseille-P3661]|uniref:inorganic phosphate transporter n=1 Tax=Bacillus sp. Marseille-P3661 TaxID=1936234 RepID=UPI000C860BC6
MYIVISLIVAFFFAMNMGASGAAASMGVAYGSGAVANKRIALLLCSIGVFLGAAIGGEAVVKTIGTGIVPSSIITIQMAIIILSSAAFTLFIANMIGIPLSTSEVTVGSVVGVGIAFQSVYFHKLLVIVSFWIIIPIIAFSLTFVAGLIISKINRSRKGNLNVRWKKPLTILLIITGFFEAFSAGMNNVSNAIGPLVGAGIISISFGTLIGGFFISLGAFLLGGKVMETNGKKITTLSLLEGCTVSGFGAGLVIIASLFGLPIPITQVTTAGILGIGAADKGLLLWQKGIIKRMLKVWLVSPVFSLVISYGLVKLFFEADFYTVVAIGSVFLATIGTMSLISSMKKERKATITAKGKKVM